MNALAQSGLVALGAAVGSNMRYWIGVAAHANIRPWPWPTLLINVLGSFILGLFAVTAFLKGWSDGWRLVFAVGLCGGFTTFSTFSFEAIDLIMKRNIAGAAGYMAASLVLCIGGCWAGGHLARVLVAR